MKGVLDLTFRRKKSGKTYIAEQYYELPMQVLPPYYQDEDGTAFIFLLNLAGGVLQGDRLYTNVDIEDNARALISTPSANRFYKMEDDCAEVINTFKLGKNSVLEYIPDYNIPYAKSETYQENLFYLDESSTLIAWDMVIPGRVGMGENFDYHCFSSKIKIYVGDELELYEYSKLSPDMGDMMQIGILEEYKIYATAFVYHQNLPEGFKEAVRQAWDAEKIHGGISLISDSLAAIKILGNSVFEMETALEGIWSVFRSEVLEKDIVRIRKY